MTAVAHHSRANFDMTTTVAFQATVTQYRYANPHTYVFVEAPDDSGMMVEWVVELGSIPNLKRMNMDGESLQKGDRIFVRANPDLDPKKHYLFLESIVREDGVRYSMTELLNRNRDASPEQATVSGSEDFSGVWGIQRSIEDILNAKHDIPEVAVTAAGQASLDAYNPDENPFFFCQPQGLPRNLDMRYTTIIEREPNKIIFRYEFSPLIRTIYLNGTEPNQKPEPSVAGFSVGRMEGETLVIETDNFSSEKWGLITGLDSGPQKKLIERYTLSNNGHNLRVEVTAIDPQYLTAPMQAEYLWTLRPDFDPTEYVQCDPEAAALHLQIEKP